MNLSFDLSQCRCEAYVDCRYVGDESGLSRRFLSRRGDQRFIFRMMRSEQTN